MFVRLLVRHILVQAEGDERFVTFDAGQITFIAQDVGAARFGFFDGENSHTYLTPSYDEAGLVELVMQARLYPDQFLPSNNVGKGDKVELGSTGSHHWSSKGKK